MSPSTLSTVIIVAFFVCLVIGLIRGFFKGAIKSTVDVGGVLLSALLALPITKGITALLVSTNILNTIATKLLDALPSEASTYVEAVKGYLADESTAGIIKEVAELIISLPAILLSPIIFIVVFLVLGAIIGIIATILKLLVCPKTRKIGWRIIGAVLSAGAYVIVFAVILIPVTGYSSFVGDTSAHILEIVEANEDKKEEAPPQELTPEEEQAPAPNDTDTDSSIVPASEDAPLLDETENNQNSDTSSPEINEGEEITPPEGAEEKAEEKKQINIKPILKAVIKYSTPLNDNFVSKTVYALGGRGIFNSLTTNEVAGVEIVLQTEINGIIDICDSALKFLDVKPEEYTSVQSDAINDINASLEESEYLPLLFSKIISFAAGEFYEGKDVFGIEKPDFGKDFNPTFDKVLRVLKDTDSDDIRKDIKTISNIANGALETGIIGEVTGEEIDVWKIVENEDMIEIILVELYKNTRTRNMVPYVTSALTNYIYEMYDDINGTYTDPGEFDYTHYNEAQLVLEAAYLAGAIREIHSFLENTDLGENFDPKDVIMNSDMGALGRGLENLREGIFTERAFVILLHAVLRSEAITETGIVDSAMITSAEKKNADLEGMLVARQNIMKLAIVIQEKQDEETKQLMDTVIESIVSGEDESLGSIVNKDNLTSLGMKEKDAESIEGIVGSILDGANDCEFETEEERVQEVEKAEEIISAVGNTVLDKTEDNMFKTEENDSSTTDMSAQDFVDSVLDSKLTSSMVQNASKGENGEIVNDPYKIQRELSDADKVEISQAINNTYASQDITEEERATLESLANIFGVTIEK